MLADMRRVEPLPVDKVISSYEQYYQSLIREIALRVGVSFSQLTGRFHTGGIFDPRKTRVGE